MPDSSLTLHGFFRSSTSFRVRIALNLKGLPYRQETYRLRAGEQRAEQYLALNPQGLVPTLERTDGSALTQSLAILEWLEERHPQPPLLPADATARARVRALSQIIALDIHPLNNLRVLGYLTESFEADDEALAAWFRHWAGLGFEAFEAALRHSSATGRFCHGDEVSLADVCLVAQSINNRRFQVDETPYPTIRRIVATCLELPEFEAALPANQPDAN